MLTRCWRHHQARVNLVHEVKAVYRYMQAEHGIKPDITTANTVLSALCEAHHVGTVRAVPASACCLPLSVGRAADACPTRCPLRPPRTLPRP